MIYKAVGFDYGGVIKGLPGTVFAKKVSELLNVSEAQYRAAYYSHNKDVHRGKIDWQELWPLVLKDLNRSDQLKDVTELSAGWPFELNLQVLKLVDRLKNAG